MSADRDDVNMADPLNQFSLGKVRISHACQDGTVRTVSFDDLVEELLINLTEDQDDLLQQYLDLKNLVVIQSMQSNDVSEDDKLDLIMAGLRKMNIKQSATVQPQSESQKPEFNANSITQAWIKVSEYLKKRDDGPSLADSMDLMCVDDGSCDQEPAKNECLTIVRTFVLVMRTLLKKQPVWGLVEGM